MELALIIAIIALATMIQMFATFKIVQIGTSAIVNRVQELDGTLAEAIASVVESGLGSFEPPNPIVAILGDYLKSNLNSPITNVEVLHGEDGKFVKKTE